MPTLIDLTGQKFGTLTVIEKAPSRNRHVYWKCRCDCGNEVEVQGYHLSHGRITTCGRSHLNNKQLCLNEDEIPVGNAENLIGQKFNKLTVLYRTTNYPSTKNARWKCQCDCGNYTTVLGKDLKNGHIKSCGCLASPDLTGQHFGFLTVLSRSTKTDSLGHKYWTCQCICGKITEVQTGHLNYGDVISCGCISSSRGERKIMELLNNNNISYIFQWTNPTCYFEDSKYLAKFDFFVNNEYIIEFDGEQHFISKNSGWNTDKQLQKTQKHDEYKNQWCKDNNIPLIRIPYTKLDTLCIEDLQLETTQFRVV